MWKIRPVNTSLPISEHFFLLSFITIIQLNKVFYQGSLIVTGCGNHKLRYYLLYVKIHVNGRTNFAYGTVLSYPERVTQARLS